MAIQIPMFLVNRTGPEWDKFVADARKANMTLQETERSRLQAIQATMRAQHQSAAQFGQQWARNKLHLDAASNSAMNLSQIVYNLNALNITPYGYERFAYRLSLMVSNLAAMGPAAAAGLTVAATALGTAAAAAYVFERSVHEAALAGDKGAKDLLNSFQSLTHEIGESSRASFAMFGKGVLQPYIKDLTTVVDTFRFINDHKFEMLGGAKNAAKRVAIPFGSAAAHAFGTTVGGAFDAATSGAGGFDAEKGREEDKRSREEVEAARQEWRKSLMRDVNRHGDDESRMATTAERYKLLNSSASVKAEREKLAKDEKELMDNPWRDVKGKPPYDPDKTKEDARRKDIIAPELLARRKMLDALEADLRRREREFGKRRSELEDEMGGRKFDADRIPTLEKVNDLLRQEIASYDKLRSSAAGASPEDAAKHEAKLGELMNRRRHFLQETISLEKQQAAVRNELAGGRAQAKQIDNVRDLDKAIRDELASQTALDNAGKLTDPEREKSTQKINDLLSQRRKIDSEILGVQERQKEMAKTRKAEIGDIHTLVDAEKRRLGVLKEMEDLKKQGLDRSLQMKRLMEEMMQIDERKLAIARELAQQQIAAARAEFQATIARRAGMFGAQGDKPGNGLIQGVRNQIRPDEVMKQLARDRAKKMLGDPEEVANNEMWRRQKVVENTRAGTNAASRKLQGFLDKERPDDIESPEGKKWKAEYEKLQASVKRARDLEQHAILGRDKMHWDDKAGRNKFVQGQEDRLFRGQLAGLRRGKINPNARGRNNLTDREGRIAQNEVARRKLQQRIDAGGPDAVNAQAAADELERQNKEMEEQADVGDFQRDFNRGGRPGLRNREQQRKQNRDFRLQDRGQQVPEKLNNIPQMMQQAAKQQMGAFQAQQGLNGALVQGFQQAQQAALQAEQQSEQLKQLVEQQIQNFNRRRGANGPGAW